MDRIGYNYLKIWSLRLQKKKKKIEFALKVVQMKFLQC